MEGSGRLRGKGKEGIKRQSEKEKDDEAEKRGQKGYIEGEVRMDCQKD